MSRYRLARQAKADLDEIWSYVARHSGPQLADRLLTSLADRFLMLCDTPLAGRVCAEFGPDLRRFSCGEYLIYYRRVRGRTLIVRVIHGARDQKSAWITPPS